MKQGCCLSRTQSSYSEPAVYNCTATSAPLLVVWLFTFQKPEGNEPLYICGVIAGFVVSLQGILFYAAKVPATICDDECMIEAKTGI